jgi:hypothetical protein
MAAQRPQTAARAVALLNWLATAHRGGRGRSIMALVTQALDTAGRVSSSRPSGPAAVAVTLEVSACACRGGCKRRTVDRAVLAHNRV